MRHIGPLLALSLLIAGCSVDLIEPPDRLCSATEPCQEGQTCQDGVCTDALPGGDGGTDAGSDAGTDGGSDAGTDAGVTITLEISPLEVEVASKATQRFTAEVSGSSDGVTWSVQEGATGGTIDGTGLYTAPAGRGTFHVVATSVEDPTAKAVATVTVPASQPDLPGLVAHYSADALLGRDVALPLDGTLVTTWEDLSGSGNTLTQGIPSRQPTLKLDGPKGRPMVAFDGTTDSLASALFAAPLPQPNTIVVVFEGPAGVCTLMDAPQGNERNRIQLGGLEGGVGVQMYATSFSQPGPPVAPGRWHVASLVFNALDSVQRVDGAPQTVNLTNLGTAGMGGILLGLKQDLQPAVDPGLPKLAELLVYDRALDTTELLAVESWLVTRYGL